MQLPKKPSQPRYPQGATYEMRDSMRRKHCEDVKAYNRFCSIWAPKVRMYKAFRIGQVDRLNGKPCGSAKGLYLDGWYAPDVLCPDFLTLDEFATVRAILADRKNFPEFQLN